MNVAARDPSPFRPASRIILWLVLQGGVLSIASAALILGFGGVKAGPIAAAIGLLALTAS